MISEPSDHQIAMGEQYLKPKQNYINLKLKKLIKENSNSVE